MFISILLAEFGSRCWFEPSSSCRRRWREPVEYDWRTPLWRPRTRGYLITSPLIINLLEEDRAYSQGTQEIGLRAVLISSAYSLIGRDSSLGLGNRSVDSEAEDW